MKINGYDVQESFEKVEYKRNENGLYTLIFKYYYLIDSDGIKHRAYIRVPNAKMEMLMGDEGIIDLSQNLITLSPRNKSDDDDNKIFEIIVADD